MDYKEKRNLEASEAWKRLGKTNDEQSESFKLGFMTGSDWHRDNIWNDVSKEVPTKSGETVIVLCKNKNKEDGIWLSDMIDCWEGEWSPRTNWEDPVKWAYLSDILPAKY